jgi:hypothetical protein
MRAAGIEHAMQNEYHFPCQLTPLDSLSHGAYLAGKSDWQAKRKAAKHSSHNVIKLSVPACHSGRILLQILTNLSV